jgi:choline kinase/phosphatidylglycerophosphate synthase
VLGMRLIERTILSLQQAGIERFVVVLGARAERIEAELDRLPRLRDLDIDVARCAGWERGNGLSLACGAAVARGPFLLAMADHIVDPMIARRLVARAAADPDAVYLATDANIESVFDLDDATKVRTQDGEIVAIDKALREYDCVDAGVFACPAWFPDLARAAVADGATSVSGVMRHAIERGLMKACPIEPLLWQDVDTPETRVEAERRLLQATRKPTDGPVSRWINRPISIATSRWLARAHVTPNMMTTLVLVIGLIAAALMTSTDWRLLAIAGVLVQLASIWDGCDGELARVSLRASRFGAWYDTLTDNVRYAGMVFACSIGLYRRYDHVLFLLLGVVFLIAAAHLVAVMSAHLRNTRAPGTHLVVVARVEDQQDALRESRGLAALLKLKVIVKQDVLAVIAAVLLIADLPHLMLPLGLAVVFSMLIVVTRVISPTPTLRWLPSLRFWLGLGGVALLGWLILQAPLDQIGAALAGLGWGVAAAIPLGLLWVAANTTGLHVLLGRRIPWLELLHNRLVGDGYNAILPLAGLGGEPVRAAHLRRYLPLRDAISAVTSDRLINLISGLLFSAAALAAAVLLLALPGPLRGVLLVYVAAAVLLSLLLAMALQRGAPDSVVSAIARWLGGDPGEARPSLAPSTFAAVLGCNLLGRALQLGETALFLHLLHVPVEPSAVLLISGLLSGVGTVFFIVPQTIGVAEATSVYALQLLGYAQPVGLAFGLARRGRILFFAALGVLVHQARPGAARGLARPGVPSRGTRARRRSPRLRTSGSRGCRRAAASHSRRSS